MRVVRTLLAAVIAASAAGCDVPEYELGYDETGGGDDSGVLDVTIDTAVRDTAPAIDSTVVDTADATIDTLVVDTRSEVDTADTADASDGFDGWDGADLGCVSDDMCAPGTICGEGGDCKPGCTATHKCATGNECCGGTCLDVSSDLLHCGSCSPCVIAHGTPKCETGTCKVASCDAGFGDCDGVASNGCEAALHTTTNCGACGVACTRANGLGTCDTGTCSLAGCFTGFENCDKIDANGCEIDLTRDPSNCGACGSVCPSTGGTPICVSRVCKYSTCMPGFGDCDFSGRCLTKIEDDIGNCGACGKTCTAPNGTPKCTSTTCGIASCNVGFDDCNKIVGDGCERSLRTVTDCGACGVACTLPNATTSCSTGACGIASCNAGFDDCNKIVGDGCERSLHTLTDCGACGVACALPSATPSCSTGACKVSSCNTGTGNCNGIDSDGCEIDTTSNIAHCGACFAPCSFPNATPSCSGSTCSMASCNAAFANCNGSSVDGCERSMSADQNTCATATVLTDTAGAAQLCANATGTSITTVSTFGHKFYKVSSKRCGACKPADPTRMKFVVKSPAGMAFDLKVYSDTACSAVLGSSASGVLGGTETVTWVDGSCPTPKDFYVEVKWRSGDGCGSATLDVSGGYLPYP
jgi:hypothetical protein